MRTARSGITESSNVLWSHNFMPQPTEDETPELATNDEWRTIMVRARKDRGLSQEQLGDEVGATQVSISKIESGENSSSKFVLPICRTLGIPEPAHFADEQQREWSQLGHLLRHKSPGQYQAALRLLHSMADAAEQGTTEAEPAPPHRRR